MNFLNPAFLISLAAVALPLIVHFFSRRKVRRVRFSSLAFLRSSQRRSMKRINFRRILLLILRMAAIALVALAFSRPVIRGGMIPGKAPSASCIVLDRSYSMGLETDSGTLLARAVRAAEGITAAAGENDRLIIYTVDNRAEKLFDMEGNGRSFASSALEKLNPSWGGTDLKTGVHAGLKMLRESGRRGRELYLISDFMTRGVQGQEPGEERDSVQISGRGEGETAVFLIPVTERTSAGNVAVLDVNRPEIAIHAGEVVTVGATLLNTSKQAGTAVPVSVTVEGERLINREVRLAPGERRYEEFSFPADSHGWLRGEISLGGDRLPYDNRRFFVIRVIEKIDVLLVGNSQYYLEKALNPGGRGGDIRLRAADPGSMTSAEIRRADAVVLGSGPELWDEDIEILREYLEKGGGLIVFVRSGLIDSAEKISLYSGKIELRRREGTLKEPERLPELLRPFDSGDIRKLSRLKFTVEPVVSGVPDRAADLRFKDGTPFLWKEQRGAGEAIFLVCEPTVEGGELVLSPYFLPLIQQAVFSVAGSDSPAEEVLVGEPSRWRIREELAPAVYFEEAGGDSAREELEYRRSSGGIIISDVNRPGFITVAGEEGVAGRLAVNPDCASESRLSYSDPAGFADSLGMVNARVIEEGEKISERIKEARYGHEITGAAIIAAIVIFIIELLVAQSTAGQRRKDVE